MTEEIKTIPRLHSAHIRKKLHDKKINSIIRLKKLPNKISYTTWSLGFQAEQDFSYEVITADGEKIYCLIVSFLGLFVTQSLYFKEANGTFKELYEY